MIGTNRDLLAMRQAVDHEIFRLTMVKAGRRADAGQIDLHLAALSRERLALCAAMVNRRAEAAKGVVELQRWVFGCGALNRVALLRGAGRVHALKLRREGASEPAASQVQQTLGPGPT